MLAVTPTPTNLTPADTSSFQTPALAGALRRHTAHVTEMEVPIAPGPADIEAVSTAAEDHDAVVVGTVAADAHPGQAALVRRLVAVASGWSRSPCAPRTTSPPTPRRAPTCAPTPCWNRRWPRWPDALFGERPFPGRLPVSIPGLHPAGHGLTPEERS